jgi:KDO2-lipid IV(A) lauroyltransferase
MKQVRYAIEAFFTKLLFAVLSALPLRVASGIGASVACAIGPLTRVHRVAQTNIRRAMPTLGDAEQARMLMRMWDNLGRVFCEYAYLNKAAILQSVHDVQGLEHLERAHESGRPILMMTGHLGNWELLPRYAASIQMPMHLLYRAANNPSVERLVRDVRARYALGLHGKGRKAARGLLSAMIKQEPVGMLVDQKANDGIAVPFFGHDAMTSDVVAHLVMKYDPIVLPTRCVRLDGCAFRLEVEPPMIFTQPRDAESIMREVHGVLERWIREDPSQWFWVHKRWPLSKGAR